MLDYIFIDKSRFKDAVEAYWLWSDLNDYVKNSHNRGVNFPETISETVACYALNLELNRGTGGDARDPSTNEIYEFKATSNWERDTSSFSPNKSIFDYLYFIRLNKKEDKAYIYNLNMTVQNLEQIMVNKNERFIDQQIQGRRPRFSVISKIINYYGIYPERLVDFRKETVQKL